MRWFRRGESASTLDLLVAGLGNPGRQYADTRHNVGFMVANELARRLGGSWRGKFAGELAEVRLDGLRLALLKPQTYMNESGRSVGAAARFFKVGPEGLVVVHDEVDLEPGRLQVRLGGGLAGASGYLPSLAHPSLSRSAFCFGCGLTPHKEGVPERLWKGGGACRNASGPQEGYSGLTG